MFCPGPVLVSLSSSLVGFRRVTRTETEPTFKKKKKNWELQQAFVMWKTAVLEEQSTSRWGCQLGSPSVSCTLINNVPWFLFLSKNKLHPLYRQQDFIQPRIPLSTKASQKPSTQNSVHLILSWVSIVSPVTIYNQLLTPWHIAFSLLLKPDSILQRKVVSQMLIQ